PSRVVDFVPTDADRVPHGDRMVHDQRPAASEISIRRPEHHPVAEGVEPGRAGTGLRDASAAPGSDARFREGSDGKRRALDEAIERLAPVGVEPVEGDRVADETDGRVRFVLCRREDAVAIRPSDPARWVLDGNALL